ncbi:DUF4136 domain-containing protein [Algoriphagus mannitolivorans]|uniref:DUF4136 domain-containing protein n=1 Tax=Algoriphagus mannitolivorans TaxID=226504 RepID=UPI00041D06CC|nr:DUF4136 domain-containing protein [Algoriphagus mannitolivorans]
MKKLLFASALLLATFSCKVSDSITIDTFAKKENLRRYHSFKMVDSEYSTKKNKALTQIFQDRLVEFGFVQAEENPDFLIQSVLVTREFIQELGQSSSVPFPFIYSANGTGGFSSGGNSEFVINKGMIGKVIFLIQDAKSYEIAWMGVGTGIVASGNTFDNEKLSIALDELLASID